MHDDILKVWTPVVSFHVLRDSSGLYLIDTGFVGGQVLLQSMLRRKGWHQLPIKGIILTHGHLDHILNAASIAKDTGAWIAAPRFDADHYLGTPHYQGMARVTGALESIGRPLLHFQPFTPDQWIDNGTLFDVWHGLRAIHLPGHTAGHTGFYCESLQLLFSADLFASYHLFSHLPPSIFNSQPADILNSLAVALRLDLEGVIPNHGNQADPGEHLRRLRKLHQATTGT